ncbi:hypothetical protein AgCh_040316 [Apium graveolens]
MKPTHHLSKNDHSTPPSSTTTSPPLPTLHSAATKIQSTYKTHLTKTLFQKLSTINSSAAKLQTLIQLQETVNLVRSNDQERLRIHETLMRLLLALDSVPGWDPNIRELRRNVSRRIVGLQEILDGVIGYRTQNWDDECVIWDEVVERMEKDVCEDIGGGFEMEKFCAEKLGFRCLQRFLRDQ